MDDPRDEIYHHNLGGNNQTPNDRYVSLENRFNPLSDYRGDVYDDNYVITQHPNQSNNFPFHQRDYYQDSPRDFYDNTQSRFFPLNNRNKRGTKTERH